LSSAEKISGIIFVGVMFLTAGILYLFGYQDWPIWVIGVGVGFIAMSIARLYEGRKGSGIIFIGFLLLFGGLGCLFGFDYAGWLIGLGVGFIAMAALRIYEKHMLEKKKHLEF